MRHTLCLTILIAALAGCGRPRAEHTTAAPAAPEASAGSPGAAVAPGGAPASTTSSALPATPDTAHSAVARAGRPVVPVQPPPVRPDSTWDQIAHEMGIIHDLLGQHRLADLPVHAFTVRDLAIGLAAHPAPATRDRAARLREVVEQVKATAAAIDRAGRGNDAAAAGQAVSALEDELIRLRRMSA